MIVRATGKEYKEHTISVGHSNGELAIRKTTKCSNHEISYGKILWTTLSAFISLILFTMAFALLHKPDSTLKEITGLASPFVFSQFSRFIGICLLIIIITVLSVVGIQKLTQLACSPCNNHKIIKE